MIEATFMPVPVRGELADLNVFLAICRRKSFRLAASELGVSTSALSHTMRGLEERLGVRLLNRTSRSVVPTDAGEALLGHLETGFSHIRMALDELDHYRESPVGRLRINIPRDAAQLLFTPVLARFMTMYPRLQLEITVDNTLVDIIGSGYDAGIRYGESVPRDMIAMPVTRKLKWIVVASPGYLKNSAHLPLSHPNDLLAHQCIRMRLGNGTLYKWELNHAGEALALDVPGSLILNESEMIIDTALNGFGLAYCLDVRVRPLLESGKLVQVIPEWVCEDEPMVMYYPSRRQLHPGLRKLIEMMREVTLY
ncbi:LysR substrate-binding domain-containing protein [Cedecea davisae]|uniref:LysR family transcriptional regulator n=1 Tax=Cedecea davisae TaxID=158484 RepID=UPI00376F094D